MTDTIFKRYLELLQVSCYVLFCRTDRTGWEAGRIATRSWTSRKAGKIKSLQFDIRLTDVSGPTCGVYIRFNPKKPNILPIATAAQLRRADPRGRLRKFLTQNKLIAVPVLESTATPIYRVLDPARNYAELSATVVQSQTLPFRFSAGSFYTVSVPSRQDRTVHLTTDGTWKQRDYIKPPGFEP